MSLPATAVKSAQPLPPPKPGLRYLPEIIVAVGLIVAPWLLPMVGAGPDLLGRVLIWGLFGLGFDLLFGYTGLLSFGQAAFFGAGGIVAAWLLTAGGFTSILPALAIGTAVAGVLGVVIGYISLRSSGIYFAMSTLAFGEMIFFLENGPLRDWTGGENGIAGVPIRSCAPARCSGTRCARPRLATTSSTTSWRCS